MLHQHVQSCNLLPITSHHRVTACLLRFFSPGNIQLRMALLLVLAAHMQMQSRLGLFAKEHTMGNPKTALVLQGKQPAGKQSNDPCCG